VHNVERHVQAPRAVAQRSAVDDEHRHQQQDVHRHDEHDVVQAEPVDQPQDQGHEIVGHLLLRHRARPQPDDRQDCEEPETQRDVQLHRA
jgi:hypothetical protein